MARTKFLLQNLNTMGHTERLSAMRLRSEPMDYGCECTLSISIYTYVCMYISFKCIVMKAYKKYPFLIIYLILVYIQFQLNHFWNPKMYGFLPKARSTPYTFGAFDFVQNHLLLFTYLFFVSLFKHIHRKEKEILREIEQDVCLVLVVFCCCCCCCYYRWRCRCRRCCRWSISLAQG